MLTPSHTHTHTHTHTAHTHRAPQVSFYHRNVARQQQQLSQWQQKRRQENAQRRLAGEEPLPEEDHTQVRVLCACVHVCVCVPGVCAPRV